jgi:hypothetical protein
VTDISGNPVHFVDYASQPYVTLFCTKEDVYVQPVDGLSLPEGVHSTNDKRAGGYTLYTFERELATCAACCAAAPPPADGEERTCRRHTWFIPEPGAPCTFCTELGEVKLNVDSPKPITFKDANGEHRELIVGSEIPRSQAEFWRHATPDDLSRAGYSPGALEEAIELHFGGEFDVDDGYASVLARVAKELRALRALDAYVGALNDDPHVVKLLKEIDDARRT